MKIAPNFVADNWTGTHTRFSTQSASRASRPCDDILSQIGLEVETRRIQDWKLSLFELIPDGVELCLEEDESCYDLEFLEPDEPIEKGAIDGEPLTELYLKIYYFVPQCPLQFHKKENINDKLRKWYTDIPRGIAREFQEGWISELVGDITEYIERPILKL